MNRFFISILIKLDMKNILVHLVEVVHDLSFDMWDNMNGENKKLSKQ